MKKTVVLGATNDPRRYAYLAVRKLKEHHHEVVPIGKRKGEVEGLTILNSPPELSDVDTVTLYLNPQNQLGYYDYILGLHPKRIIFNPGTENPELEKLAEENGIEVVEGCTLVMLNLNHY